MSTSDDASATRGTHQNIAVDHLNLPTFTPISNTPNRPRSQAASSTTSSQNKFRRQNRSVSGSREGSSRAGSDDGRPDRPLTHTYSRRSQQRSSGGFLLESTAHSSRLSRVLRPHSPGGAKGKRKGDVAEISQPKRRNRQSVVDHESSHRSSPLSVEVRRGHDGQHSTRDNNSDTVSKTQDRIAFQVLPSGTSASPTPAASSVGRASDTAQIVDMALKLSEGRRRQASGKRVLSGETSMKMAISSAPSRQLRTPTNSVSQHVSPSRAMSISPLQQRGSGQDQDPDQDQDQFDEERLDSMLLGGTLSPPILRRQVSGTEKEVKISRATMARVEKTKVYLELAYEHRRLLSHLPPIPGPGFTQHGTTSAEADSKIYNPLQYVRNRKLRYRERSAIDTEADGWYDVDKVRTWVNAVIDSHGKASHGPLECLRLPPLNLQTEAEDDDSPFMSQPQNPNSPSPRQQQPQTQTKLRRPRSDWVTHPASLIADAFWLEQGLNKTKIQDRDNNPIYPADAPFKFSGWRNKAPVEIPPRLQQPTPPPETISGTNPNQPLSAAPELPTFTSAHVKNKDAVKSTKQKKQKASKMRTSKENKKQKLDILESSSDADSDPHARSHSSSADDLAHGRRKAVQQFDLVDGDPYGRGISAVYHDSNLNGAPNLYRVMTPGQNSVRSSADQLRLSTHLTHNDNLPDSMSHGRSRSLSNPKMRHLFRQSKEDHDDDDRTRNSVEDDSTAPNSPLTYGLPSIAINLDPPVSRSPSPTKKSRHHMFRSHKDKARTADNERIDATDFAAYSEKSHSRDASIDTDKTRDTFSKQTSRSTSPYTRGRSPLSRLQREPGYTEERYTGDLDSRPGVISRQTTRQSVRTRDQHSRLRGIFKGGRIAELVGNEVSRVGDFIWKREVPPAYRHHASGSEASSVAYDLSDLDEHAQDGVVVKTPFREARQSMSTQSSVRGRRSSESSRSNGQPLLNNPNLPSFTSPFQRDRERQEKKQDLLTPDADDHISRQVAYHRHRSKSPRLDQLALPKLDTNNSRAGDLLRRTGSYDFGPALSRSQSASQAFNSAINQEPDKTESARSSVAAFAAQFRRSIEDNIEAQNSGHSDQREISRVQTLMVVTAIKARNICIGFEQIPAEPSKILLESDTGSNRRPSKSNTLEVRRRDEYVVAAHSLIARLTHQSTKANEQLQSFSTQTASQLHEQIQALEDQIENTITPRVRVAADNAGEFSVKLTTTSRQAVKSLDDEISEAFRLRRRGPVRWLRLLGFTLIEWTVVGLLWLIWAIVTIVRIVTAVCAGTGRTVRWLFWMD